MENFIREAKEVVDGRELSVVVHENILPGPILCVEPHVHDYIEILYCLSGVHQILLNQKLYTFSKGDMIIINSNEIHQINAVSKEISDYIVVRFEPELFYTSAQDAFELKYLLPFTLNEAMPQKVFSSDILKETDLPQIFNEILIDYKEKPYCYEFAIRTNICRIFLWILKYWNQMGIALQSVTIDNKLIEKFRPALEYIDKNFAEDLSAAKMADLCNISYSYFSRTFKMVMNKGFREYLNYQRISKSELLLATTDLSITDIAMQVGFSTSSYFIQQFKLVKGISPNQFRKKFVGANNSMSSRNI